MSTLQRELLREAARVLDEQRSLVDDASDRDLAPEDMLMLLAELGRRQAEVRKLMGRVGSRVGLPTGAKARLLLYLQLTIGKVVDKEELSGVSGIYEWARRVRELRVEEGWPISSSENRTDLAPGQYVLENTAPDLDLQQRWQIANSIRRTEGSAVDRVLGFLSANIGRAVSQDELYYVSQDHDFEEIVRTLAKQGWDIRSHKDEATLRPGEYRLEPDR